MHNYVLMLAGIGVGGVLAWVSGKRVAMTDMPQMIALYNGMGGGAAAAIAAVELFKGVEHTLTILVLAVAGALIGAVSFSGSLVAFAKLQGLIRRSLRFRGQQVVNLLLFAATVATGIAVIFVHDDPMLIVSVFFVLALLFGILLTVPIGGVWRPDDSDVEVSLFPEDEDEAAAAGADSGAAGGEAEGA